MSSVSFLLQVKEKKKKESKRQSKKFLGKEKRGENNIMQS